MMKDVYQGMLLEILNEENNLWFLGKVTDVDSKRMILRVADSSGHHVPPIIYNATVNFRGFASGMCPITGSGKITGSCAEFWSIGDVETSRIEEHRANFRQRVQVPAKVMLVNDIFCIGKKTKARPGEFECTILDISAGGVQIASSALYDPGDYIFLFDFDLLPDEEPFACTCTVLRCTESESGYLYGCQFEGLTEQESESLTRAIFITQRNELRTKRKSGRV